MIIIKIPDENIEFGSEQENIILWALAKEGFNTEEITVEVQDET